VEIDVIFHECGDEEVGMIVAILQPIVSVEKVVLERGGDELFGQQLPLVEELVLATLVNEN